MPIVTHKVFAYSTVGTHLLVFRHPDFPEAGIQVPAGTVEEGEDFTDAVLREAYEETGLGELTLAGYLGDRRRPMSDFGRDEIHHRHFYHVRYTGAPSPTWRHAEHFSSDDPAGPPIVFEFFWASLPDGIPALLADHGALLPVLCHRLFGGTSDTQG